MKWLPYSLGIVLLAPACGSSRKTPTDAASTADSRSDVAAEAASSEDGAFDVGAPDAHVLEAGSDGASPDASDTSSPANGDAVSPDALADGSAEAPDDVVPVSGSPFRALALSTGLTETCALLDNHRIKCWGANVFGSLGEGDTCNRGAAEQMGNALPFVELGAGRTATALSSGRYHSCAILDDGSVKCWGFRMLTGVPLPPASQNQVGIGDEPGEMGDALAALDLGPGRKATQIACGYYSSCALLDDGSIRCWGGANLLPTATPLAGTSKVRQLAAANNGVAALYEDGTVSTFPPYDKEPITLPPGKHAVFVAGGGAAMSLCAVVDDGSVTCAIETAPTTTDLVAYSVGLEFSCGLTRLGDVRCWGLGEGTAWSPGARLPDGSAAVALGQKAVALTSGNNDHVCAVLVDGSVKCWGTRDLCMIYPGTATCPTPTNGNFFLGSSLDIVRTGASCTIGAWNSVNLGTHP
jgi:Regulator of chromosome condensation (RCC1) repeat